ncbi:LysR family transcriptional regulator [Methylobacterium isbiliense]|uniref:HTH-type transcriptional regulator BenM n=1 Tax=Methylobacterium isbiliense TaxID=315478 RepID=A0ABQ4SLF3_9HYPH|nr:LysR family transcriptional regulator [Methylobacterium isbiliense]MDN3627410.1 LysR family transcriptional regulator [Methylobacterium isbiliense]GJE04046.1 HTH-type transcriptional regulator BenM [Methylobacterium isbiliense]
MELRHLRYFVAVAREQSFTRAAETMHVAQPALSKQIQQFEDELGVPLIERGSRPVRLTEPGRLIFEQALQILERVDDLRETGRRLRLTERNRFRIGFVASTLYGRLPEILRGYRLKRPDVDLTLLELLTLEQIAALKEGRIDVGFGRIEIEDPAIARVLLRNERMIVAVPMTWDASHAPGPLKLHDLADTPLIVYPKGARPNNADRILALFRDHAVRPPVIHEVRELQTALGLVAAEAGICVVPASVERLRRDGVAYRPLDEEKALIPVIMSYRKDDPSPEIGLILACVHEDYEREGLTFGV